MAVNFADLPEAIDPAVALNPVIPADKTAFATEELDDATALGIALSDVSTAISYFQSKGLLPAGVDLADDLIRAYVKPRLWSDGKPRASMPMYVVLEAVEKIMPTLYMAMFGSGKVQPFLVTPQGKTTDAAARAKGKVLYWAVKQAGLKEQIRLSLKTCLSYGFCAGWTGWESKNVKKRIYEKGKDNKVKGTWKEVPMNLPTYENVPLKNFGFDPRCIEQNVHTGAGYVYKQAMISANDLQWMREDTEHYKNIPSDEELREILSAKNEPTEDSLSTQKRAVWREFQAELDSQATSKDPLEQPLEYIEYVTADRVIGVLQRKLCIRNQENERNKLPARSCAFVDVLGSAWGFGVARLLSGEQRFQVGIACNWVDGLSLTLNPMYQILKGIGGVGTQNIPVSPGKVMNLGGELKVLEAPDITAPAMAAIESSEARAVKRVGANGGADLPHQALRTGTGVQALTGDVVQRLQYFLEIFISNIYLPVLEEFLELCYDHLQPEQINHILTEEGEKAWEGDIIDVYNAQVDIDVLGGANLMAKYAAAQLVPQFLQLMSAGPVAEQLDTQGIYFDFANYTEDIAQLMGIDPDVYFKQMTPEMKQVRDARNQAAIKAAADTQLQDQKHQDALSEINEKGTVNAGVAIVKKAAETHLQVAQDAMQGLEEGGGQ
jgi:hypothetical protein